MDLVKIALGQTEFLQQELNQLFRAVVGNLKAHAIPKPAAEQLTTQGRGQVFQIVFKLKVGVTGQPELIAAFHLHAGEELVGMGVDHGRQEHQVFATIADIIRQTNQAGQRTRSRHNCHAGFPPEGVLSIKLNNEVQAFVDQTWERVRRIQPDGADHRQDLLLEISAHPLRLLRRPLPAPDKVNVLLFHLGNQHIVQYVVLLANVLVSNTADLRQGLVRHHAIGTNGLTAVFHLLP